VPPVSGINRNHNLRSPKHRCSSVTNIYFTPLFINENTDEFVGFAQAQAELNASQLVIEIENCSR
jgi:hypothetical protein